MTKFYEVTYDGLALVFMLDDESALGVLAERGAIASGRAAYALVRPDGTVVRHGIEVGHFVLPADAMEVRPQIEPDAFENLMRRPVRCLLPLVPGGAA